MKEIFDGLREQIEANAFRQGFSNDVLVKVEDVGNIINEAEAKWESEVCEWDGFDNSPIKEAEMWTYKTTCKMYIREEYTDTHWKFCPYCGKPIKISEVE